VAFKQLTANPSVAAEAEAKTAIKAAEAVVDVVKDVNRIKPIMSLMALMYRTQKEALQLRNGKPYAPMVVLPLFNK
jgi:uncharacterized membrane protein YadS